jgi:hypothetical protein
VLLLLLLLLLMIVMMIMRMMMMIRAADKLQPPGILKAPSYCQSPELARMVKEDTPDQRHRLVHELAARCRGGRHLPKQQE